MKSLLLAFAKMGRFRLIVLLSVLHFAVGLGLSMLGVLPADGELNWTTWIVFGPLYGFALFSSRPD